MATVILRFKDTKDKGVLFIQQVKDGKKRLKSLSIEMKTTVFKKCYVKKLNKFTPDKSFDSNTLNKLIDEYLKIDLFEKKEINNATIIHVWNDFINMEVEPSKKYNYSQSLNKFIEYLTIINRLDITPSEITPVFIKKIKNWLLIERKNTENSTKQFFILLQSVIKHAKTLKIETTEINIKELKLKRNTKQRVMLSNDDVTNLFNIQIGQRYFYEANVLKLSIGMNGLRFKDLFFLKWSDLNNKTVKFIASKTKKPQSIPYNNILIDSLYHFILLKKKHPVPVKDTFKPSFVKTDKPININDKKLKAILNYAKNNNGYIIDKYVNPDIFEGYNILNVMTVAQYKEYTNKRSLYNMYLNNLKKHHKLSIPKLTSHYSRYILVQLLLEKGTDIKIISKLLQHSSLEQTMEYIKKNYDEEYFNKAKDDINEIYSNLI